MTKFLQAVLNLAPVFPSMSDLDFLRVAHSRSWLVPVRILTREKHPPMPTYRPRVDRVIERHHE